LLKGQKDHDLPFKVQIALKKAGHEPLSKLGSFQFHTALSTKTVLNIIS